MSFFLYSLDLKIKTIKVPQTCNLSKKPLNEIGKHAVKRTISQLTKCIALHYRFVTRKLYICSSHEQTPKGLPTEIGMQ